MLSASSDLGVDAELSEPASHLRDRLSDVDLPLRCSTRDQVIEFSESLRMQGRERKVLQLLAEFLDSEAMSQRGIDVERLLGDAALLLSRHRSEGPHVVEAVGEFDHQHTEISGHGHEHLAHSGRLLGLPGVEPDPLELRDPIDDCRDVRSELRLNLREAQLGVFYRVMQKGGRQRDLVESDLSNDSCDGERVVDVALSARPGLSPVGVRGNAVRARHHLDWSLRVVPSIHGEDRREFARSEMLVVSAPWEDAIDGRHVSTPPGSPPAGRRAPRVHREQATPPRTPDRRRRPRVPPLTGRSLRPCRPSRAHHR